MRTLAPMNVAMLWLPLAFALVGNLPQAARAQIDLEQPPLAYAKTTPLDAVTRLEKRLANSQAQIEFEPHFGYLRGVLAELGVPHSSQALVFSKTSLQVKYISPTSPRAIYFSDDVYVGWVPGGNIEVSAVDPRLGANFYVVRQQLGARPRFERQTYDCLQCHASGLTRDVPGHLVRSVFTAPDGQPILRADSYLSDHSSPLRERWGGWYVTGRHGAQRHLGNLFVRQADDPTRLDLEPGANVMELERWFESSVHLTPHSDLIALMVLEHQTNMHNRLTRANFLARLALAEADSQATADGAAVLTRRLKDEAMRVVEHLLFARETRLTEPIVGSSSFAREFADRGPRDARGRSLRDFDLKSRMFRYPCSYLIYSEAFEQLPGPLKDEVYRQLWDALHGVGPESVTQSLSPADCQAIIEILRATKEDLPEHWKW